MSKTLRRFVVGLAIAVWPWLVPLALAQSSDPLTIVLDPVSRTWSAPMGWLTNVPSGATSATLTLTLTDGSTRTVTTTAEQGWRFDFTGTVTMGSWYQLAAMTSNGAGASLPNDPLGLAAPPQAVPPPSTV